MKYVFRGKFGKNGRIYTRTLIINKKIPQIVLKSAHWYKNGILILECCCCAELYNIISRFVENKSAKPNITLDEENLILLIENEYFSLHKEFLSKSERNHAKILRIKYSQDGKTNPFVSRDEIIHSYVIKIISLV